MEDHFKIHISSVVASCVAHYFNAMQQWQQIFFRTTNEKSLMTGWLNKYYLH